MTALWILVSSFCSAGILACIQCLGQTLAFLDIAFVEFAFVLAVTTLLMIVQNTSFRTHVWKLHFLRSVLGLGVVITQIITVTHMPVAAAQTLQYTSPLFVATFVTLSALRKKEQINWRLLAAIAFAFAGICVMFHPSTRSFSAVYVIFGLVCGLLTALSILLLKRLGNKQEPVARTVFYFHLHGTIIIGILECFYGHLTFEQLQQLPLGLLLVLLVFGQFTRTLGWGKGHTLLGSALSFSGVVFATLIDALIFGRIPNAYVIAGMCIIIAAAATCLVQVSKDEKRKALGQVRFVRTNKVIE